MRERSWRGLVRGKLHSVARSRGLPEDPSGPLFINTNDTINRNTSVSVILFEGAPARDKAHLATMWVNLGQPISCAAVPMWVAAGEVPSITTGPETAPLNDWSKKLAAYLYPDQRGRMKQYLAVDRLRASGGEGVLPRLFRIENEAIARAADRLAEWGEKRPAPAAVAEFQEKLAAWVFESLQAAFPEIR